MNQIFGRQHEKSPCDDEPQSQWADLVFWVALGLVIVAIVRTVGWTRILTSSSSLWSWAALTLACGLAVSLLMPARFLIAILRVSILVGLLVCIVFNIGAFRKNNKAAFCRLRLVPNDDYPTLLEKNPVWSELGQYYMYNIIRRHAAGMRIITYDRQLLPEYYVCLVANVGDYFVEEYPHELTNQQADALLRLPHYKLQHPMVDIEWHLIRPGGDDQGKSDFRVYGIGKKQFLIPVTIDLPVAFPSQ